jgi:hypothetical protein
MPVSPLPPRDDIMTFQQSTFVVARKLELLIGTWTEGYGFGMNVLFVKTLTQYKSVVVEEKILQWMRLKSFQITFNEYTNVISVVTVRNRFVSFHMIMFG